MARIIEVGAVDAVNGITYVGKLKVGFLSWKMRNYTMIPTEEVARQLKENQGIVHYRNVVRQFYEAQQKNNRLEVAEDLEGRMSHAVAIHDLARFPREIGLSGGSLDKEGVYF